MPPRSQSRDIQPVSAARPENLAAEKSGAEVIIVNCSSSGRQLLRITPEDLIWPDDVPQALDVFDVLSFLKIKHTEMALYDLIREDGCGVSYEGGVQYDELEWGQSYLLLKRTCPRCTLCDKACQRVGVHKLCSHGPSTMGKGQLGLHLWHSLNRVSPGGKIMVTTQGYCNGCGLREEDVFPADVLSEDLCGLCDQFGIQCSWRGPVLFLCKSDAVAARRELHVNQMCGDRAAVRPPTQDTA